MTRFTFIALAVLIPAAAQVRSVEEERGLLAISFGNFRYKPTVPTALCLDSLTVAKTAHKNFFSRLNPSRLAGSRPLERNMASEAERKRRMLNSSTGVTITDPSPELLATEVTIERMIGPAERLELSTQGYYREAIGLQSRVVEKSSRLRRNHYLHLGALHDLAYLQYKAHAFQDATLTLRSLLAAVEEAHPSTILVTSVQNDLGAALAASGKLSEAEDLYRRSIALKLELDRDSATRFRKWTTLANLGALLQSEGRLREAEGLYREVLSAAQAEVRTGPFGSVVLVEPLLDLGLNEQLQGHLPEALANYQRATPLASGLVATCIVRNALAVALQLDQTGPATDQLFAQFAKESLEQVRAGGASMGDADSKQRILMEAQSAHSLAAELFHGRLIDRRRILDLIFDFSLEARGRTLESIDVSLRQLTRFAANFPLAAELLPRLQEVEGKLLRAVVEPTQGPQPTVDEIIHERDDIVLELGTRAPGFRQLARVPTHDEAVKGLRPREVAIDFVKLNPLLPGGASSYHALMVNHSGAFDLVRLGPADVIESASRDYRESVSQPGNEVIARLLREELHTLLVAPLLSSIPRNVEHIFLSTDGPLGAIPWDALLGAGHFTNAALTVSHLGTLRDLVRLAKPAWDEQIAATQPWRPEKQAGQYSWQDLPYISVVRGLGKGLTTATLPRPSTPIAFVSPEVGPGGRFPQFQSSQEEHSALSSRNFKVVSGADASKANLFAMARRPSILHLSSTGFTGGAPDPMLTSGLALAGANVEPSLGILTAKEMGLLDLRGTELVVLSACDTGLGETTYGNGLMGIQRGLAVAGARSQLLTLWRVQPAAADRFLGEFYRQLNTKGIRKAEALRRAKSALSKYPERDWAGFVLYGDPGPMKTQ